MDAVYILGTGSLYNDQEIKYSIRSLERYCSDIDRIIIIGEKPKFFDYGKIEHHYFKEKGNKDFRIASKILFACDAGIVNGNFLFLNDDFFFTNPFSAENYPFYQKGELLIGESKSDYQNQLALTRDYLELYEKATLHFDVHTPIVYNSKMFQELREHWQYSAKTIGLVVKSMYCNMHGIIGTDYQDLKIKSFGPDVFEKIKKVNCFTINDASWNNDRVWKNGLSDYLKAEFPNKSKYEL